MISFVATEKEQNILHYLFKTKVATFGQIHRNLFGGMAKSGVSRRLQRLLKQDLIQKGFTDFKGKSTQVFCLEPQTVDFLFSEDCDPVGRYQAQSGTAEHDLILADLRIQFLKFEPVRKYWTENELQCLKECAEDPKLLPFIHLRSDAVLELVSDGEKMVAPLECEVSRKANSRYEEKIRKYYERENTLCVLFISGSPLIQKAVMETERTIVGEARPKFYYALLENALKDEKKIEFTNLRGGKFILE